MRLRHLFLLISALMAAILITLTVSIVRGAWSDLRQAELGLEAMRQMRTLLIAAELASAERGPSNAVMGSPIPNDPEEMPSLQAARDLTDEAYTTLLSALDTRDTPATRDINIIVRRSQAQLKRARQAVDQRASRRGPARDGATMRAAIREMFLVVELLSPGAVALNRTAEQHLPTTTDALIAAHQSALLRELAGQLGSHLIVPLATQQRMTREESVTIERLRGRIEQLRLQLSLSGSSMQPRPEVRAAVQAMLGDYFAVALPFVDTLTHAEQESGRYPVTPAEFAQRYVPSMGVIATLRDTLMEEAIDEAGRVVQHAGDVTLWITSSSVLMLVLLALIWRLLHRRVVLALTQTTELIVKIASGQLDVQVPPTRCRDEVGDMLGAISVLRDNSVARKAAEDAIREMAYYDRLTGLPNRRLLEDRMQQVLASAQRRQTRVAVMFIDLDKFKQVNDRHGHEAGDWLLSEVAKRMRGVLRESDTAARVGGDEFVVLLPDTNSPQEATLVAEKIRQQLEQPFVNREGRVLEISSSIGVAMYPDQADNPRDLLHCGDEAMYWVKKHGRNAVAVFDTDGPPHAP
ncbi:GGDEF domain-containing protein [Hylemonella gracilis]|uniref:Diguanylate cyclase n=1 Tax=Hylemonella gracilis ATCC 19624 TaxID=887062 RepID=F3KTL2_9BURK|nr:GGDEF domain-containing protein [Hylemonella gracilis]EGI76891.1 hypothetical protein HGR_08964 [Hylemonella gracilis ATCC 19624]